MNTKTKLAVEPAKASELMALGYEIECYVILPDPCTKKRQHTKPHEPHVPPSVMLQLAVGAKEPMNGAIASTWMLVKTKFFSGDPTKMATRKRLEEWVVKNGGKKNEVSQFIHAYKCLRVVEK